MAEFKVYHVRDRNVGQTLAQMLRSIYAGKSWGEIKRVIEGRRIQINGNLCVDEARRLKVDEVVRIYSDSLAKPAEETDLNIRFQDEHLLVVEKPAGLTTLRHAEEEGWDDKRKSRQPTLDELLQNIANRNGFSKLPGRGAGTSHPLQKSRKNIASRLQHRRMHINVRRVHRLVG